MGELEKNKVHIIVETIEYLPNAIVSKTIIKEITGIVTASSFDEGDELAEKSSPFDNFIQIIGGTAEVMISGKNHRLTIGQGIITPAPTSHILEHFVILCKIERVK